MLHKNQISHRFWTDPSFLWRLGLLLTIFLGSYLRFRGLTFQSYWDDELFSMAISNPDNSLGKMVALTTQDVHPPLFQFLLWCWFKLFGFFETVGRIFPAIFGALSIYLMYCFGREIHGVRAGIYSSFFCSINVFHLFYSQEVRSYSLLFFLAVLSLLYFLRFLKTPTRLSFIKYMLATAALGYTHFFGIFILLSEVIVFLLNWRGLRSPMMKIGGGRLTIFFALLLLPLVALVLKNASISSFWIKKPGANFIVDFFLEYFGSPLIAGAAVAAVCFGAIRCCRSGNPWVFRLFLLCLFMVWLFPYARSLMGTPLLTTRNTIVALPIVFALMGVGFSGIEDGFVRTLLFVSFGLLSLLLIFHQPPYYRTISKPQIREVAQALVSAHPDVDSVYAKDEVVRNLNLYLTWMDAPFRVKSIEQLFQKTDGDRISKNRFWVVDGRAGGPIFDEALKKKFNVLEEKIFFSAGYMVIEQKMKDEG